MRVCSCWSEFGLFKLKLARMDKGVQFLACLVELEKS